MNFHSPSAQAELKAYNEAMERSLEDKLFFLEHTAGATTFVDFGCANGAVLKAISERRGAGKTLIGIDINEVQLHAASQKVPNGVFVQDFELVRERLAADDLGPKVAIFSSVLHEAGRLLVQAVNSGVFDYIVVRDMGVSGDMARTAAPNKMVAALISGASEQTLTAWVDAGKGLNTLGDLTEFILKYPYLGHTEVQTRRELAEAYPIQIELSGFDMGFAPTLFEHYSAPWVVDRVRTDFGFEFPFPTHFKLILKKVVL